MRTLTKPSHTIPCFVLSRFVVPCLDLSCLVLTSAYLFHPHPPPIFHLLVLVLFLFFTYFLLHSLHLHLLFLYLLLFFPFSFTSSFFFSSSHSPLPPLFYSTLPPSPHRHSIRRSKEHKQFLSDSRNGY